MKESHSSPIESTQLNFEYNFENRLFEDMLYFSFYFIVYIGKKLKIIIIYKIRLNFSRDEIF